MKSLKWHFWTVLGQSHFVEDTDGGKSADVTLLLKFLALPERRENATGRGQWTALKGDHVDLHEMPEKISGIRSIALHDVCDDRLCKRL